MNIIASILAQQGTVSFCAMNPFHHQRAFMKMVVAVFFALMSPSIGVAQIKADVTVPPSVLTGQKIDISIQISKGELTGFAKLEHRLPEGFTAESTEAAGSTFKFADGKVKFLWMDLPSTSRINVSYKVGVPETSAGTHVISGMFSYVEGSDTRKYRLPDAIFIVGDGETSASESIVSNTINSSDSEVKIGSVTISTESMVKEGPESKNKHIVEQLVTQDTSYDRYNTDVNADGVVFRVQVLAGRNSITLEGLAQQFSIDSPLSVTEHEGLFKYTTGEFENYRAAKALSNELRNTTNLPGPFVVAFAGGKRIPMNEFNSRVKL